MSECTPPVSAHSLPTRQPQGQRRVHEQGSTRQSMPHRPRSLPHSDHPTPLPQAVVTVDPAEEVPAAAWPGCFSVDPHSGPSRANVRRSRHETACRASARANASSGRGKRAGAIRQRSALTRLGRIAMGSVPPKDLRRRTRVRSQSMLGRRFPRLKRCCPHSVSRCSGGLW